MSFRIYYRRCRREEMDCRAVTVTDGYAGSVSKTFGDVIFCLADTFRNVEAAGEEGCYSRRQRAARSVGIGGVNAARFEQNRGGCCSQQQDNRPTYRS